MRHFITNGLEAYELMVKGKEFSYGNGVTLADICLMPQLYNAERWDVKLQEFHKISSVKATLDAIPAFQRAHPDETTKS